MIEISPVNSTVVPKLLDDRAIANSKIGLFRDAIKDCTNAMKSSWMFAPSVYECVQTII